jgi:hypothetical protein
MTELQQRALAVALREHQEEQPPQDLVCPVCGDGGYDRIGMAGHFSDCAEAKQIASEEYLRQREWQAEHLAELQAKKDAGDERLLCAVLFEGKGEPN